MIEKEIIRVAKNLSATVLPSLSTLADANLQIDKVEKYEGVFFLLLPTTSKLIFSKLRKSFLMREYEVTFRAMFFHDFFGDMQNITDEVYFGKIAELRNFEAQLLFNLSISDIVKNVPNDKNIFESVSETFFYFTDSNLWGLECKFKVTLHESFECLPCLPTREC